MGSAEEQTMVMSPRSKEGWFRKPRPMEDLLRDSALPYQIGRLIGAAEMAAHQLQLRGDDETKQIGAKLAEMTGWFFDEVKSKN
jgi:hypothetical protein